MNIFYYLIRLGLKGFFHLFYRCEIIRPDEVYKGSAIIAPNHTSFLDPPLVAMAWPEEIHFLARASLFSRFYMEWLLRHLNAHAVQGSSQEIESFKIICKLLAEGKKVVIFPEGERSFDGQPLPIKSGIAMLAMRMSCPIIPVYIHGAFEAWPRQSRFPKFGTKIICIFGKPICVEAYQHLNKKEAQEAITKQVQLSIQELSESINS